MHEGRGDLDALIATLEPPFVLLLQEAVPALAPFAASRGLYAAYVPSMPNGREKPEAYVDRGNAIVSTLRLEAMSAIELPWVYQRRVAVMATVDAPGGAIHFVCVHLDNRPGRKRQASALAQFLRTQDAASVIVGGDLNTWFGPREAAVEAIDAFVPRVRACGTAPTFRFGRRLDYLFASAASDRSQTAARPDAVRCDVLKDRFGSDHHPIVLRLARISGIARRRESRTTRTARRP
jgi:endonuclease/exonuclease/phosphatase family metal-dependent hydrolase